MINGVHPGPFQRALIEDEAQRRASAYMHFLRSPEAEAQLSANNFERLFALLSRFGPQPWLTPEKRTGYLEAWAINPARDLGPRLFAWMAGWGAAALPSPESYWWVPIAGPLLGGVVGGGLYQGLIRQFLPARHKARV